MSLQREVPLIKTVDDLLPLIKPLYIIEDYTKDYETYINFQENMFNTMKGAFIKPLCRQYPITFKFYLKDTESYTLELRHFMIHIFLWYPFVELHGISGVLNKTFIMDCYKDVPNINKFINRKIIQVLKEFNIKSTTYNQVISTVEYNLRRFSAEFSLLMMVTISTEEFLGLYNKNPEFREIMECKFPEGAQPSEVENILADIQEREIAIFKAEKDSNVGIILRSGTGMKHQQLVEYTASKGLIPSLTGETIPIAIENSTLIRGLDKPSYVYLDAGGARKSLVMNKKVMGKAGYFGKIVLMLSMTTSLSKTVSDCGSQFPIQFEIKNKKILNKLDGRFYKENLEDDLTLLDASRDEHLVGKTIYVRSPITCASHDGKVCAKCFGFTANLNYDIADGVAGFESEEWTKVVNQSILSTKHLLTTNSETIEFNEEFYKFFRLTVNEITANAINNEEIPNIEDYAIYINPNDIMRNDEMDNDSSYNTFIFNGKFIVRNLKTKEEIVMQTKDDKEIFITEDSLELMKQNKGLIKLKDLDDDTILFEVVFMNNELTKPLYELMDLLNKSKKNTIGLTIDEMGQKFLELLVDSHIDANSLSGEIVINRLIRDMEGFERPDFSGSVLPEYQIYTVAQALEHNNSPLMGLSFQNLKRQILSDDIVTVKTGTSYLDPFFKKKVKKRHKKKK